MMYIHTYKSFNEKIDYSFFDNQKFYGRTLYRGTSKRGVDKLENDGVFGNFFSEEIGFAKDYGDYIIEVKLKTNNVFNSHDPRNIKKLYDNGFKLSDEYVNFSKDHSEHPTYNFEENEYSTYEDYDKSINKSDTWEIIEKSHGVLDWIMSNYEACIISEGGYTNYYIEDPKVLELVKIHKPETILEKRVNRSERLEIYRDSNIVVIAPLTHDAHKKYATNCQWCINSDLYEWEQYHKGDYVLIIQRKEIPNRIGISGHPTSREIFGNEQGTFEVDSITDGEIFNTTKDKKEYFDKLTKDINNFDLNVVYYNNGNMFDRENNNIFEYNIDNNYQSLFSLKDIPNITNEAIKSINKYLTKQNWVS